MPSISTTPIEQHPFTMANVPSPDGRVVFLIRVHRGFTARLAKAVAAGKSQFASAIGRTIRHPAAALPTLTLFCLSAVRPA